MLILFDSQTTQSSRRPNPLLSARIVVLEVPAKQVR